MGITIYLVHGTWPRGGPFSGFFRRGRALMERVSFGRLCKTLVPTKALWFEEGSVFRRGLSDELDVEHHYETIEWSGRNSLHARMDGAARLRGAIHEGFARDPGGNHVVIAHSHGGNVAMYALRRLPPRLLPHGVATLATPFLELRRRKKSNSESVAYGISAVLTLVMTVGLAVNVISNALPQFLGFLFMMSSTLLIVVLVIFSPLIIPKIGTKLGRDARGMLLKEAMPLHRPSLRRGRPSFLAVRANNDEATRALTAAWVAAVLNRGLRSLTATVFSWCLAAILLPLYLVAMVWQFILKRPKILVSFLLTVVAARLIMGDRPVDAAFDQVENAVRLMVRSAHLALAKHELYVITAQLAAYPIGTYLMKALFSLCPVVLAINLLARLLISPFGVELFFVADSWIARVNASPSGIPTRLLVVLDREIAGGSAHSVYVSPSGHVEIARWIKSLNAPDPQVPVPISSV